MKPRKSDLDSSNDSSRVTRTAADVQTTQPAALKDLDVNVNVDVDTLRLVALQHNDKLELVESAADVATPPFDPYNNVGGKPVIDKPRRSIDDLRKLSAEIVKSKHHVYKSPKGK